jgi:hypothetical protein
MTFSDDNSDGAEDLGESVRDNVGCNPKFDESCSLSEPHLLT